MIYIKGLKLKLKLKYIAIFQMLLNLHKKSWMDGLTLSDYTEHCNTNEETVKHMLDLAKNYNKVNTPTQMTLLLEFMWFDSIDNKNRNTEQLMPEFIQLQFKWLKVKL